MKKLIVMAILLTLCFSLGSCGSKNSFDINDESNQAKEVQKQKVVLELDKYATFTEVNSVDVDDIKEGDEIKFKITFPSFVTTTEVVVSAEDKVLTPSSDSTYTVTAKKSDLFIKVSGNSVLNKESTSFIGDGSESSPYTINTPLDLITFSEIYNKNHKQGDFNYKTTYVKLNSDINMEGYPLIPINNFCGDFNGNSKVISNFNIDGDASSNLGLFSTSVMSDIYDFRVDSYIHEASTNLLSIGVVAGRSFDSTYHGITLNGSINGSAHAVGGMVGSEFSIFEDGLVIYEGNDIDLNINNSNLRGYSSGLIGSIENKNYQQKGTAKLFIKNNKISGQISGYNSLAGLSTYIPQYSTISENYIDSQLNCLGLESHTVSGLVGGPLSNSKDSTCFLLNNIFAGSVVCYNKANLTFGISSANNSLLSGKTYYLNDSFTNDYEKNLETRLTKEEINSNLMGLDDRIWSFSSTGVTLKEYKDYYDSEIDKNLEITFIDGSDGKTELNSKNIWQNHTIDSSYVDTEKENLIFVGWFLDEALSIPYENSMLFTKSTNLYAKWKKKIDYSKYVGNYTLDLDKKRTAYLSVDSSGNILYYIPKETCTKLIPLDSSNGFMFSDGYMSITLL